MLFVALILGLVLAYWIAVVFGPFPYWRSLGLLWKTVLTPDSKAYTPAGRRRQLLFLTRQMLLAPVWSLLWHLDDVLYPGYRRVQIRPVFIVGQPRSGTTLLHRTLAEDEATFFAVRHIEWRFPFISLQKLLSSPWLPAGLLSMSYWPDTPSGRRAAKMHPNRLSDWEEDGIFFEERMLHHFFLFLRFPDPAVLERVDDFASLPRPVQERFLRIHQRVVQKVAFLRGGSDQLYLSKEVTSHDKIPSLMDRYPQARFIVLLRGSRDFMGSLIELMRNSTLTKTGVDPTWIPGWHQAFAQRMERDSKQLVQLCRHILPADQQIQLSSAHLMAEINATVAYLYRQLGITLRPEFAASIAAIDTLQRRRDAGYSYAKWSGGQFDPFDELVQEVNERCRLVIGFGGQEVMKDSTAGVGAPSGATSAIDSVPRALQ